MHSGSDWSSLSSSKSTSAAWSLWVCMYTLTCMYIPLSVRDSDTHKCNWAVHECPTKLIPTLYIYMYLFSSKTIPCMTINDQCVLRAEKVVNIWRFTVGVQRSGVNERSSDYTEREEILEWYHTYIGLAIARWMRHTIRDFRKLRSFETWSGWCTWNAGFPSSKLILQMYLPPKFTVTGCDTDTGQANLATHETHK